MSPPYAGAPVGGSAPAYGQRGAFGDVPGDRVDSGAGVPLQEADGGMAGAGLILSATLRTAPIPGAVRFPGKGSREQPVGADRVARKAMARRGAGG